MSSSEIGNTGKSSRSSAPGKPASAACPPARGGKRKPLRLGEMLIERGLLTQEQLETALEQQRTVSQGTLLGEILVELGMVQTRDVIEAMAASLKIPFAVLSPEMVQPDALAALPMSFLNSRNVLPISLDEGWLTVACEQFSDVFLIEDIAQRSRARVQVVAACGDNIRETREHVLAANAKYDMRGGSIGDDDSGEAKESIDTILGATAVGEMTIVEQKEQDNVADLKAAATDSPIVKLVNYIVQNAVEVGASDIHIEPEEKSFRVRFRVDGELVESVRPQARLLPAVVSRIKIMGGMDISERRLPQDGGVTVMLGGRHIDLRVSTMATKFGEKVVMRIVDRDAAVPNLDSIGFEPEMLKQFRGALEEPNGIVLVTGPTGSGKSTTLYGALSELVSDKYNISTIEDPVERQLPGTNQFQVHNAAGFTFAQALRALLRQDPDIIMVGEIRDPETAKLATEAAITGHLVLSTLHTNDAPTAVPRLVNMGVEPYLVAASLRAVLAQRLVRRICSGCCKPVEPSAAEQQALIEMCGKGLFSGAGALETVFVGTGCPRCRGVGYIGRIGVFELLRLNEELLSTVARAEGTTNLRQIAQQHGYTTLLKDGMEKVRRGLISVAGLLEIVSRSDDSDDEQVPEERPEMKDAA